MPRERVKRSPQSENIIWITYRGRHIPIRSTQTEYCVTNKVDEKQLQQLQKDMLRREHRNTLASTLLRECIVEHRRGKNQVMWATDRTGKVIYGGCTVSGNPKSNRMYLDFLAAHPQYKGKGVGSRLLIDCYKKACETGKALVTFPAKDAIGFYEKCGWRKKSKRGDAYIITPKDIQRQAEEASRK